MEYRRFVGKLVGRIDKEKEIVEKCWKFAKRKILL